MRSVRALKRSVKLAAAVAGMTCAIAAEGSVPRLGRSLPAVGGNVGDVITTTCGNSPVIVLAVVVCDTELPRTGA